MARLHRERFPDPNVPPPGSAAVTYGEGLVLTAGPVLKVDFGDGHSQAMRGDESGGADVPSGSAEDIVTLDGAGGFSKRTPGATGSSLLGAANAAAGRSALSLGNAATRDVGTTSGTVAAGDDARFTDVPASADRRHVDAMDGSGWTTLTPSGGASASWSGGKLTLDVPPSAQGFAGVERANGAVPDGAPEWDILCRVDVTAGDNYAATRVSIVAGADDANCVVANFWTDGTLELGKVVGGVWGGLGFGGVGGLDSTARTGGQLWLRLSRRLGGVYFSWAVGSAGAVPLAWRTPQRYTDDAAVAVAGGTYVRVSVATTNTSVTSGLTVEVLAIRARGAAAL